MTDELKAAVAALRDYQTPDWRKVAEGLAEAIDACDTINGEIDRQTYAERVAEDFDLHKDHEFSVILTADQIRSFDRAIAKAQAAHQAAKDKDHA